VKLSSFGHLKSGQNPLPPPPLFVANHIIKTGESKRVWVKALPTCHYSRPPSRNVTKCPRKRAPRINKTHHPAQKSARRRQSAKNTLRALFDRKHRIKALPREENTKRHVKEGRILRGIEIHPMFGCALMPDVRELMGNYDCQQMLKSEELSRL
jgi:hypothetical protein